MKANTMDMDTIIATRSRLSGRLTFLGALTRRLDLADKSVLERIESEIELDGLDPGAPAIIDYWVDSASLEALEYIFDERIEALSRAGALARYGYDGSGLGRWSHDELSELERFFYSGGYKA